MSFLISRIQGMISQIKPNVLRSHISICYFSGYRHQLYYSYFNLASYFTLGYVLRHSNTPLLSTEDCTNSLIDSELSHNVEDIWSLTSKHPKIYINFVLKDNTVKKVIAPLNTTLLEVAHHYNINVEGACEASLACSTCHVIIDENSFKKLPEATDREDDLLDMAPHITDTSRLSCQIKITKELDGMEVRLPLSTLNFYVDGHLPTSH